MDDPWPSPTTSVEHVLTIAIRTTVTPNRTFRFFVHNELAGARTLPRVSVHGWGDMTVRNLAASLSPHNRAGIVHICARSFRRRIRL